MEKLFELAIAIGMSVFAFRVGSEGMRRLNLGERPQAFTILSLSAAIFAVQVAVVLSAFQSSSIRGFAGEVRDAAASMAPADAQVPAADTTAKVVHSRSHHKGHPAAAVGHPPESATD